MDIICAGPACDRAAIKRGYCNAHYSQFRLHGYTWKFGDKPHRQRKVCVFPDCGRPNFAHGLCAAHRRQKHLGIDLRPVREPRPSPADGYHWCSTCKTFRAVEDFSWDNTREQPQRVCMDCCATSQREYTARNAEKIRLKVTLRTWGLTEEQYVALFEAQGHKCAICGAERRELRNLAIDHCHKTGLIRGLLCPDCNMGMGQFGDDPALLESAATYLRNGGVVHDEALRVPENSPMVKRSRERDEKRARRLQ